jgi:hypothetical protein
MRDKENKVKKKGHIDCNPYGYYFLADYLCDIYADRGIVDTLIDSNILNRRSLMSI